MDCHSEANLHTLGEQSSLGSNDED